MPKLNKEARHPVTFTLNGTEVSDHASPRMLLSDFLTHTIGITSCHVGCEHGVCGACTVLIDGVVSRACLTFAVQADGATIETAESLASDEGELSDLQKSFRKHHGLQCGYCTPGILMSLTAYLKDTPKPTEEELRDMLSGHLCRCTGYVGMVKAVLDYCETHEG
ncbi:MAG: 2-furoyl-CoA dehydrogenase 2Fe-2S iron sulfur subunit [Alphaproteobacteria bacterium]|jgi:2-furoyl-CoA dehydrogenase 2Fe-2S iron sulfur subunit